MRSAPSLVGGGVCGYVVRLLIVWMIVVGGVLRGSDAENMRAYITDSGNYALCRDCGTVIVMNQQWFKTPRHAWREKSYKMLPYCPTCEKFRNYSTMTYVSKLPE